MHIYIHTRTNILMYISYYQQRRATTGICPHLSTSLLFGGGGAALKRKKTPSVDTQYMYLVYRYLSGTQKSFS